MSRALPGVLRAGGFALALLAGACAQPGGGDPDSVAAGSPRPAMAEVLARLPAEAAGMMRGGAVASPALGADARTVDYATPSRTVAAQVTLYDRGQVAINGAAVEAELASLVRESTSIDAGVTGRSFREVSRSQVPLAHGGPLRCALLEGRLGRTRIERHLCVGTVAGRFLRTQLTMAADGGAAMVDAPRFAREIGTALRAGGSSRS
ncbi:hypothetical protein MVG78_18670 [Roseomonas gilardii subsp. gilardii]|uniref:hypothetical protein n=1 Tax=Roseomonas gilardii TaxID=257708 RepID=UPI001FF88579|nr:hypothetical protein [Roseomonas gilardii]UPG72479.1 hypothetical protein MVG78_18670 [Roseomonas gilardii subsp. gilardii]